jgi:hypothetical protein
MELILFIRHSVNRLTADHMFTPYFADAEECKQ